MASLSEILIIRGLVPITSLDTVTGDAAADDAHVRELVQDGVLTESQVASARAAQLGLPFVDLTEYPVDRSAVALVPLALLRRHNVLPIGREGDRLLLAMADPQDVLALDDVRANVRMQVRPVVAERTRPAQRDRPLRPLRRRAERPHDGDRRGVGRRPRTPSSGGRRADEDDAPIVRFVNLLISQAIQDHASDIHIEPAEHDLRVRYRIDGVLHEMQRAPKNIQNGVISRLKIMSDIDIAERRKPQDGRMSVMHGGRQIDLRVATLPTVCGEKVVMRILDNSSTSMGMEQLHLLERNAAVYKAVVHEALRHDPRHRPDRFRQVDDALRDPARGRAARDQRHHRRGPGRVPDGRHQPGAGQPEGRAHLRQRAALHPAFRPGRRAARRDPRPRDRADRDRGGPHRPPRARTLHTNDAPSAVTRLTEMDIEPFLVGSALDCVVAQRLARRLCDQCKQPYQPPARGARRRCGSRYDPSYGIPTLFRAVGCTSCSNTGYRGRIALHEVMAVTEEIERLAVARASSAEIAPARRRSRACRRFVRTAGRRSCMGLTSIEEILRVVA